MGLLGALQPPELTKYLTVSEGLLTKRNCIPASETCTFIYSLHHTHDYTHIHTHTHKLQAKERGLPEPPRASSRTNLSHLTKKEKIDRHRELSRLRYHLKRKQALLLQARLEQEVGQMRTYQEALNMAPFVMVVVSAHINNCRILYANKPVTEKLGYEVDNLLDR